MRRGLDFATVAARVVTTALALGLIGIIGGPIGVLLGLGLGSVLGGVHGWTLIKAQCYPPSGRGWLLLAVDHTWSFTNTMVGAVYLALNLARRNEVDVDRSLHRSSLVLKQGVLPGFATTLGPVEAGTTENLDEHEYIHVLQARIFGPLYLPLVGLNYVVATVVPYWLLYHDHSARPIKTVRDYFMQGVYRHVWNEEWAYRVAGEHSPPSDAPATELSQ